MILKHIYVFLRIDEFPSELITPFGFRTRYVCNYIQRALAPLRFRSEGFNMIGIYGCPGVLTAPRIVPESALACPVSFDAAEYSKVATSEGLHELIIGMIVEGIDRIGDQFEIPSAEIHQAIESFRAGGYRNEWTHRDKLLRGTGLRASLNCHLDRSQFVLSLRVRRRNSIVFAREILVTKPDEIIFKHQFKDVLVVDDSIVVTNWFDRPLFSLPLSELDGP